MADLQNHEVMQFFNAFKEVDTSHLERSIPEFIDWWLPSPTSFENFYGLVGARNENLNPTLRWWMSQYSNFLRAGAMRAYWGTRYQVNFKEWLPTYVAQVEKDTKVKLPLTAGSNVSGLTAFLGLTSGFAVGFIPREALREQLIIRVTNGIWWQRELREKRSDLPYLGKRPSSFPLGYPAELGKFLITLKDLPWQEADPVSHGGDEDDN